jgi:uncharacterized protein
LTNPTIRLLFLWEGSVVDKWILDCLEDIARYEAQAKAVREAPKKEYRGFATMLPEKQREIASKGGHAAQEKGTAHRWTADEARNAGRKGGQVSRGGRGQLVPKDEPALAVTLIPAGESVLDITDLLAERRF